jgi:hypothetical protein
LHEELDPPNRWKRGALVEMDGVLAVVVGLEGNEVGDDAVPEDHVAVWFGHPQTTRLSQGGSGGATPEVWLVPAEHFELAAPPDIKH